MFLPYTWHAYIVLHLSHWLHSRNSPCTIFHVVGHSPLRIYGYLWLLTNRSGSGLVLHETMPSALLLRSVLSCLQLNRNNRLRRCRRNRMSLVRVLEFIIFLHIMFTNKSHSLFYGQRLSANNLRLVCTAQFTNKIVQRTVFSI